MEGTEGALNGGDYQLIGILCAEVHGRRGDWYNGGLGDLHDHRGGRTDHRSHPTQGRSKWLAPKPLSRELREYGELDVH